MGRKGFFCFAFSCDIKENAEGRSRYCVNGEHVLVLKEYTDSCIQLSLGRLQFRYLRHAPKPLRSGRYAYLIADQRDAALSRRRRTLGAGGFFLSATSAANFPAVSTRPTAHNGTRAAEARSTGRPSRKVPG